MLVVERPLAQAVKSFERADPITLPFISPESKFDPGNLIGRLKKPFLKGLLLVKCAMILAKRFYLSVKTKDRGCQSKETGVGMEVRLLSVGARGFFSPLRDSASPLNRPFARSGHMARNKLCWDASYTVGLSKQRKVGLDWYEFLCFGSPTA